MTTPATPESSADILRMYKGAPDATDLTAHDAAVKALWDIVPDGTTYEDVHAIVDAIRHGTFTLT